MQSKMVSTVMLMLLPFSASAVDITDQHQKVMSKSGKDLPDWLASTVSAVAGPRHVYPKSGIDWKPPSVHVYPHSKITNWQPPSGNQHIPELPKISVVAKKRKDEPDEKDEKDEKDKKEKNEKEEKDYEDKKEKDTISQPKVPFGDLEAFGREDTAKELTEVSKDQTNEMVDQLERAEVAEEKRSVFRALTRLRGLTITSFDGIARSQVSNIASYAKKNKFREQHPVKTLAEEESDVSKWAFPAKADFLQMNHTSVIKKK